MNDHLLRKGTRIKTVFAGLEVMLLVGILLAAFSNDGESIWGYWGSLAAIFSLLSPIFIYVIPSSIFNVFNLIIVIKNRHTSDSIIKYHKLSKTFLIWGIITGGLYGSLLVPIFLLENIFLFNAYRKELKIGENT